MCPADGDEAPPSRPAEDAAATPAPTVPGYKLGAALGAGGFAVVWDAHRDGRPMALKISRDTSEAAAERIAREARALAAIGAPAVPELFGTGRLEDGRAYVAMERLVGSTLAQLLESLPEPPGLRSIRTMSQAILEALIAVHQHGIIHRDLKPENIFVVTDRSPAAAQPIRSLPEGPDSRTPGRQRSAGRPGYSNSRTPREAAKRRAAGLLE